MSSRKRYVVKLYCPLPDRRVWSKQTVVGVYGGGKPPKILKRTIHYYLVEVGHLTQEAVEDGAEVPVHDAIVYDSSDFSIHYLKKRR